MNDGTKKPLTFEELEKAFWVFAKANHNGKSSLTAWMRDRKFEHDGTLWSRTYYGTKSNSGKSIVGHTIYYEGDDGRRLSKIDSTPVNRRNDPNRNWGLGRD